jgi:prevent-host-death family protein
MYAGVMDYDSTERSAREAREHFADVINDAIQGRITYITSHGRRVAAIVPLAEITRKPPACEADQPAVTP